MKNLILIMLIGILGFSNSLYAQSDTTRIKIGSKKIIIIEEGDNDNVAVEIDSIDSEYDIDINALKELEEEEKKKKRGEFEGHWKGFQFGFNGLIDSNNGQPASEDWMSVNQARSWTFGLNLFQYDIPLIKENFGIVSGLGLKWRNYHFDNNINLVETDNGVNGIFVPEEVVEYTKNRLQATYLDGMVGFELQFPVGKDDAEMFLLAGAYGSYKMGSNYMLKWKENGNKKKDKTKDDYSLTDLEYGLTARVGVGKLNMFANYSLTPLFDEGSAQGMSDFYPVTVGIMIVGF